MSCLNCEHLHCETCGMDVRELEQRLAEVEWLKEENAMLLASADADAMTLSNIDRELTQALAEVARLRAVVIHVRDYLCALPAFLRIMEALEALDAPPKPDAAREEE